jgi:lipid A 3-O-deacylase
MHRFLLSSFLLGLLLPFRSLHAEATPPIPDSNARKTGTFTFHFENDWFGGTDRHYTNGAKWSWLFSDLRAWGQEGWRKRFLETLPFVNRPEAQRNFGFAFGQNIYTPQDQDAFVPDPADRPYAGWGYFELTFMSKTERVSDTVSFQLGMVGRHSYAQDMQRVFHEWLNDSRPNGWEHQLHDEVGLNMIYERRWRLYARAHDDFLGIDLVPHAGLSLGNVQTHANAGGTLRLGFNLPSDFGVQLIRPGGTGNSPIDDRDPRVAPDRHWSFYLFAAVDGRAVARDIFLDGNTFRDSPSVEKEPFVADLSYGAGFIAGRWQLTFTQVVRTREFKDQPFNHNDFGSLTLSYAF